MKHFFVALIVVAVLILNNQHGFAQRVLNESESVWVVQAKSDLEDALTDPSLTEAERLKLVEQSAIKLKEYGQPSAYPQGETPLRKMMDDNFEQCKDQIVELSGWSLNLQNEMLDQQLRLINTIQISVVEEQVKMLIPGSAPVSLSKDVINSVFDWNISEGFNGGQRGDTQGLTARFKQLAQSKELVKKINLLIDDQKRSLALIDKDRDQLELLEAKLKQRYEYGEASTFTRRGYEGAVFPGSATSQSESPVKSNVLVGTWKFGYEQTGYFYLTFNNNGTYTFVDQMNDDEDPKIGKYSVSGNVLTLYGPGSECGDVAGTYPFEASDGELTFGKISDKCVSRMFTLNHMWEK